MFIVTEYAALILLLQMILKEKKSKKNHSYRSSLFKFGCEIQRRLFRVEATEVPYCPTFFAKTYIPRHQHDTVHNKQQKIAPKLNNIFTDAST